MIQLLERFLNLRRGDLVRGFPLILYLFLIISSYMMGKVARDALFLDRFEAIHLPYVDMAIMVAVGLVMAMYLRIGRRVGLNKLTIGSLWLFAAATLAFWWFAHYEQRDWLYPVFYIWIGIFGVLGTTQVWTLANYLFTTRETKRLVGVWGSGAIAGGIIGGFFSTALAQRFGTESLLLVMALCLFACSGLVRLLWRRRASPVEAVSGPADSAGGPKNLRESMEVVWKSPYLMAIAGIICLTSVVTALVGWQFKAISKASLLEKDELAAFFGIFYGVTGVISLVMQLLLTSRMLRRLGLGVALMILPAALLGGSVGVLVWGALGSIVVLRGFDGVIRYSIDRSTVEMLYLPLSSQIKLHVKSFIDTVVWRLGDGLGGIIVLMFATFLQFTAQQLSWISMVLLGAWLAVALVAKRHYVLTLSQNIQQHKLTLENESMTTLERSTVDVLTARLGAGDPKEILYALDVFELERHSVIHPAVRDLLRHPAPEVRRKALSILNAAGDKTVLPRVETMLQDEDIGVRTEALLYLAYHAHIDPLERIQELGDFPNFSVRSAMVAYLSWPGKMQNIVAAQTILETMTAQEGPNAHETRLEAARLIAALPDHFEAQLRMLVEDENPVIARQAIKTVGSLRKTCFVPDVLIRLNHSDLAGDAIEALGAFGEEVVDPLRDYLVRKDIPLEARREIPKALLLIGTASARDALVTSLLSADTTIRARAITTLNTFHTQHPEMARDTAMIETAFGAEILGQYRTYQLLGKLGDVLPQDDGLMLAVRETMTQRMERIFGLMALAYPGYDIMSIYTGFQSNNHVVHDNALEFLDNILKPQLRSMIVPLLDREAPDEERRRMADQITGASVDDVEEALSTLMGAEDPWLKSHVVYTIGHLRLSSLKHEIDRCIVDDNPLLRETARQAKMRLEGADNR